MAKQPWSCTQRQPTVSVPAQEFGLCPQEPGGREKHKRLGIKETQVQILGAVLLLASHKLCERYFLIFEMGTVTVPAS